MSPGDALPGREIALTVYTLSYDVHALHIQYNFHNHRRLFPITCFDEIWPGFVLQATPFTERKGVVVHAAANELIGHKFCHGDNSMVAA